MKKSIFDRGVKILTGIATVLLLFVLVARFETPVHAQACAPTIRIDVAGCIWDNFLNTCSHFFVPGTIVGCNTTTCRTIPNVCSSNDPCTGNSAATCQINGCSPGYCSVVAATPLPPGATPGPPMGSCDGCSDAGSCSGKAGSWSASSGSNHPECAAQGGYCSGTSNCGGGGPGGTPPPGNLSCGQACSSSSQCRNPSPANVPTACINGTCQSTMCPVGMTIPGANCSCGANTRKCGQTCNGAIGLCGPGQGQCTHINPPGNWYDGLPDCLDNNTYCAGSNNGYSRPKCNYTDTGNSYLNKNGAAGTDSWKMNIIPDDVIASCQLCGNGTIEKPEACDAGTNNGTAASTCTTSCQPQTFTFTVNTQTDFVNINSGDPVTLDWSSVGVSNLVASDDWSGSKSTSGTQVIPNVTTPRVFTLTGTQNSTGLPISVSVNVNINGQTAAPQITIGVYVNPKFDPTYGHWINKGTPIRGPIVYTNSTINPFGYNAGMEWTATNATSCFGTTLEGANVYAYPPVFNGVANPGQNWPYTYISAPSPYFLFDQAQPTSYTPTTVGNHHWRSFLYIPDATVAPLRPWRRYGTFRLTCTGPTGLVRSRQVVIDTRTPSVVVGVSSCSLPVPADPGSGICANGVGIPKSTNWTWPAIAGALSYNFRIEDSSNAIVISNRVLTAASICSAGVCTATFPLDAGRTYHSVVSVNTSDSSCTVNPAPQTSPAFTLPVCTATLTSTVQTDTTNGAQIVGGACSVGGASAYSLGGTVTATKIPSPPGLVYSGPVDGAGVYTITSVPYSANPIGYNLTFVPPAGYFVTCPASGTYPNVTVPNVPVLPFFVSPVAEHWFQTKGGDVAGLGASGTTAVKDPIPVAFCAGSLCEPFFSLPLLPARQDTVGLLFTMSGSNVDLNNSAGSQTGNVGSPSRLVATGTAPVLKESYDYFWRLFSMGLTSTTDLGQAGNNISDAREPNPPPNNGSAYYAAGNMTIESNNWNVTGNKSKVIFVNGDLTIKNEIKVDNGSFLAFIVKRDIIIDPSVGTLNFAQTTDGQVQGVYFAGRDILVGTVNNIGVEKKFIGEGTFAAKGAIKLLRDYRNGLLDTNGPMNNQQPASLVIYRPDFLINAPAKMKSPTFTWKEINP